MVDQIRDECNAPTLALSELQFRKIASSLFSSSIARSPEWDMLLDLWLWELAGQKTQTTYLIDEAGVARATGLRLIEKLERKGLVERFRLTSNRHSRFVRLSDLGRTQRDVYFRKAAKSEQTDMDRERAELQTNSEKSAFDW